MFESTFSVCRRNISNDLPRATLQSPRRYPPLSPFLASFLDSRETKVSHATAQVCLDRYLAIFYRIRSKLHNSEQTVYNDVENVGRIYRTSRQEAITSVEINPKCKIQFFSSVDKVLK